MSDKNLKKGYVYTHDEAAKILDKIDDELVKHDIRVPSPEDEDGDRDEHETGLYGSTYDELLNYVAVIFGMTFAKAYQSKHNTR